MTIVKGVALKLALLVIMAAMLASVFLAIFATGNGTWILWVLAGILFLLGLFTKEAHRQLR